MKQYETSIVNPFIRYETEKIQWIEIFQTSLDKIIELVISQPVIRIHIQVDNFHFECVKSKLTAGMVL